MSEFNNFSQLLGKTATSNDILPIVRNVGCLKRPKSAALRNINIWYDMIVNFLTVSFFLPIYLLSSVYFQFPTGERVCDKSQNNLCQVSPWLHENHSSPTVVHHKKRWVHSSPTVVYHKKRWV